MGCFDCAINTSRVRMAEAQVVDLVVDFEHSRDTISEQSHSSAKQDEQQPVSSQEAYEITVLVKFQTVSGSSRNQPVVFSGSKVDLLRRTRNTFSDVISAENSDIYFQIEDSTWGPGIFVDLLDQKVENRSILIAFEKVCTCYL